MEPSTLIIFILLCRHSAISFFLLWIVDPSEDSEVEVTTLNETMSTAGVTADYGIHPHFSIHKRGIHKRNANLYSPGLSSVSFSIYCIIKEAYRNGASVYIFMCGVVKILRKWECNTWFWSRCQDYFLLFGYLTFLCMKHQFIKRSTIFQSSHVGAWRNEGSLRLWTRHPEYNVP